MKQQEPLVSVIVPVYNVEKYLERCVNSLLKQSFDDYEVVLVDDGSQDHCPIICDTYAKREPDKVRTFHKDNGGLSDARNFGARAAKGQYITFVDSDDYVESSYLEDLLYPIFQYDIDCVGGGIRVVFEKEIIRAEQTGERDILILGKEDALRYTLYAKKCGVSACCKMFKRHLLEDQPFPTGMLFEDLATIPRIIASCEKIAILDKIEYYYVRRQGSITKKRPGIKELQGLDVSRDIYEYIRLNYPSVIDAARYRCALKITDYMANILEGNTEDKYVFQLLQRQMKNYWRSVLKDREVPVLMKIKVVSVMLGYQPSRMLWTVAEKIKQEDMKKKIRREINA